MTHKLLGSSVAAITVAVLLLTVGSGAAVAQVVASATGSGQIYNPDLRTFTFNATTDSSGVTTGQTEVKSRSGGIRWHGTINCLSVSGNVATMSGLVTDIDPSTPPFFVVGSNILFQVIDNGGGSNAPPDLISLTFFFGVGPSNNPGCTGFGTFANIPISHGNVTVH